MQRTDGKDGDQRKLMTKFMKVFTRMVRQNFERWLTIFSGAGDVDWLDTG